MDAAVISRTKNFAEGTLVVQIADGHGNVIPHTVYVLNVPDVEADIAAAVQRVEDDTQRKLAIFANVSLDVA